MLPITRARAKIDQHASGMYLDLKPGDENATFAGKRLSSEDVICPDGFPAGFSTPCKGTPEGTTRVDFSVNGSLLRSENVSPYCISGDISGEVRPWKTCPREGRVLCKTTTGEFVELHLSFMC